MRAFWAAIALALLHAGPASQDSPEAAKESLDVIFDRAAEQPRADLRPGAGRSQGTVDGLKSLAPVPAVGPAQPQAPPAAPKGTLVLVMVDGLSHERLREAMGKGVVPNISALLASGYQARPYLSGLPTVTQAVQVAVLYGRQVPGNEWYSKSEGREVVASLRERSFPADSGLLHKGRVYLSELSGGASEGADVSRMYEEDVEALGRPRAMLKELGQGAPLFMRHLWSHNPFFSVPGFFYHAAKDAWRMRRDFKQRGFQTPWDRKAAPFISLIQNLWSPIAVAGIKRAIRDKAPVVYTDLASYDEEAHYYGSSSPEAFEALALIDRRIGEIAAAAGAGGARLVVFSDHGQTPTENFILKFGKSMQAAVDELAARSVPGTAPGAWVFLHAYSMGNLYLADTPGRVDLSEIQRRFPGLVDALLAHPGVGAVAARAGSRKVLLGKGGKDPLPAYADPRATRDILLGQIHDYLDIEESGDLVVFAPYEKGSTLDYNVKYTIVSEHGGMGGEQMHPFILFHPGAVPLDPSPWTDARGLHHALRRQL